MSEISDDRAVDSADARLALWLGIHRFFSYHPERFVAALHGGASPEKILRDAGGAPLPIPAVKAFRARRAKLDLTLLALGDPGYPERFLRLSDAPPLLFVRGTPDFSAPAVAVVGARAASVYGKRVARDFAAQLAAAGVCVTSGLARGIDSEAHRGALDAGGRSHAFLGSGIDRIYPAEHRRLADRLSLQGALLSEFPMGAPPRAPHFPARNRLISASVDAVVIVEARIRSGSLVTARHALDQGVEVWAVPGPITAPTSAGPLSLLRDGAAPLVDVADLLASLGVASRPVRGSGEATAERPEADPLLAALTENPLDRDALGRRLGLGPAELAARLVPLELDGRVREDRDGRLHVAG